MRIVLIAALFLLSGCGLFGDKKPAAQATQPAAAMSSGEKLVITKATWAAWENYKYWLTPVKWDPLMGEGYFAVSKDGRSWGLTGCTANKCEVGTLDSHDAVAVCETRSGGVPCVVFGKDQDVVIPYEIAQ